MSLAALLLKTSHVNNITFHSPEGVFQLSFPLLTHLLTSTLSFVWVFIATAAISVAFGTVIINVEEPVTVVSVFDKTFLVSPGYNFFILPPADPLGKSRSSYQITCKSIAFAFFKMRL